MYIKGFLNEVSKNFLGSLEPILILDCMTGQKIHPGTHGQLMIFRYMELIRALNL